MWCPLIFFYPILFLLNDDCKPQLKKFRARPGEFYSHYHGPSIAAFVDFCIIPIVVASTPSFCFLGFCVTTTWPPQPSLSSEVNTCSQKQIQSMAQMWTEPHPLTHHHSIPWEQHLTTAPAAPSLRTDGSWEDKYPSLFALAMFFTISEFLNRTEYQPPPAATCWVMYPVLASFPPLLNSLLGLPGITSHIKHLHLNLYLRVCFWVNITRVSTSVQHSFVWNQGCRDEKGLYYKSS